MVVHAEVASDPRIIAWASAVLHSVFVDDWVMQAPLVVALQLVEVITERLATRGLPLQLHKCVFHVPALRGLPREDWPVEAHALEEHIPFRESGIVLLGTEACGDKATELYEPDVNLPDITAKRKAKAFALADALRQTLALAPPAGARQAVVSIIRGVLARAFDYDAGVLPCSVLLPHALQLDALVVEITKATFDRTPDDLTAAAAEQLTLPTAFAGLQIVLPSHIVPLARTARLLEDGPKLRAAIAAWNSVDADGVPIDPRCYDGVDNAKRDGIEDLLHGRGIPGLGGGGAPVAGQEQLPADPFRPESP